MKILVLTVLGVVKSAPKKLKEAATLLEQVLKACKTLTANKLGLLLEYGETLCQVTHACKTVSQTN